MERKVEDEMKKRNHSRQTHVFMLEPGEDLDFSQSSLAVGLVLEGRDLLDGHLSIL